MSRARAAWLASAASARPEGPLYPQTYKAGQPIMLDPAGALYAAIGAGNLRAYADTDAVGHAALANLAVGSTP